MRRGVAMLMVVACGSSQGVSNDGSARGRIAPGDRSLEDSLARPVARGGGAEPVGRTPGGAPRDATAGGASSDAVVRVAIAGERIAALAPADATATAWLWPPIVDSHVHLALWPVGEQLAGAGVLAAVDLGAPERALGSIGAPLHVLAAGPMLTHGGGYPLDAWGSAGYGVGCDDAACVTATIDRLVASGARVVKLALDDDGLAPALVPVAVAAAHAHHVKVAAHALSDAGAAIAARAGVDILAHTPIEPLRDDTARAWRGRAVISTLAAFGAQPTAIANLRRLRAAGALVLYGTDLGNLRDAGPSPAEIAALRAAGLDDAAIADAMTTAPIAFWGLDLGVAAGAEASFVVVDRDPRRDVTALLHPRAVYLRGRAMR